jgi:hypothetical protein
MEPRFTVTWSNYYDAETPEEAAYQAVGDLNDALRYIGAGVGTNLLMVTDNETGDVRKYEMSVLTDSVVVRDNNR